jgi:phenylphosphate carboxylase beta subunit
MMAIESLRDFIQMCEDEGELKRIKAEVDWDLELSHISKLNDEMRGPALLFENVKDCIGSVLTGAFVSPKRLAMALGMPTTYSMCDMAKEWMRMTTKEAIPPIEVNTGPVMENVIEGDKIDLTKFPAPKFFPLDGGRYIGTAALEIEREPETGDINLAMRRMMLLGERTIGVQVAEGKRGEMILEKHRKMGKPVPCAIVIGADPITLMAANAPTMAKSEYETAGALRGAPVEIITSDLSGLLIPAQAEIVIEGEIDPNATQIEGPFGEITGYYRQEIYKPLPKPFVSVKRVWHRNNPILWAFSSGRPITEANMMLSLVMSANLWKELMNMRIRGIQSVYMLPQSAGRFWAVVSIKNSYAGHANHVNSAVIASTTGFGTKGVIVVDDDIDADDIDRVLWALTARYDPWTDTQLMEKGRYSFLDFSVPPDREGITSRIFMDATTTFEWKQKPVQCKLDDEVVEKVKSRWQEYGLD